MKNKSFHIGFSFIILLYAGLYIATSKPQRCDGLCAELTAIDTTIEKWPDVVQGFNCQTNTYCIYVKDSIPRNYQLFGDSACRVIKNQGLPNWDIYIIRTTQRDTVWKQKCL